MPKKKTVTVPIDNKSSLTKKQGERSNKQSGKKNDNVTLHKSIAENRKAKHQYELLESIECGLCLMGSEVKSMREGKLSLDEAYIRYQKGELWLINADVAHYNNAGMWNHDPRRSRKLLLHARELSRFASLVKERGLTMIPLRVYFNERGVAKCVMALARGKKLFDKRETLKKRDAEIGLMRAIRRR